MLGTRVGEGWENQGVRGFLEVGPGKESIKLGGPGVVL